MNSGVLRLCVWKEQPNDVKQEFLSHFQDRFAKPSERRANIDMRFPKTISEDQSQDLEREVSKQEIKTAVWGCGTDKSPGPDGFSFGFYRHFWPVIEHDVYMAVNHFFIHGEIPPGCLKINLNKSKIMEINVESAQVIQAAAKLGCLVLKCPFYYLGTRVGGSMTRVQAWQEIVEKVKSRLSKWKSKTLSIGGRLTLLKSVLGSIPVFHMSIFKVPSKVLHILESIRSHFFNGHDPGSKKASWVKWNNVLTDKKRGGLGVSSLFALNRGLMIKWVWKFLSQKDSLWTKVIVAIHGVGGKIHSEWTSTGKSCWLSILSEVRSLQRKGMYVFDYLTHKMGNGESTKFWLDHWHTRGIFKDIFPRLYALESSKDVTVSSKIGDTSLVCSFRRIPRGGIEQNQFDSLVELVRSVTIVPSADRWNWNLESTGIFSVASARRRIDEICLPNIGEETRWVKCVPIKINVLAWKIKTDALPTRFNISRRGIDIQDMSCPICDNAIESTDHLFFRCGLVRDIANKVLSWWNLDHANLNSYAEWKSWLVSIRMDSKLKKMFEGVWYSIWWYPSPQNLWAHWRDFEEIGGRVSARLTPGGAPLGDKTNGSNLNDYLKEMEDMGLRPEKQKGSLALSHLFSDADDAFFMGDMVDNNLERSRVGRGLAVEDMASSLGCTIMENKFRYLGVMVGAGMTRHKAWDDVILKLQSRLSKWKAKTLSIGGRLTLLKSVLGEFSLYYNMSIFKVPKGVLKAYESIRSNFFKVLSKRFYGDKIDSHSVRKVLERDWIGDIPCVSCVRVWFALILLPHIWVAAKMAGPTWDTSFRRTVRGGRRTARILRFYDTRLTIDDLVLPSHSEPTRWIKLIPIKINVFMWRARRGCLPTRYNLVQKGVILESTSCPVCFSDEEDVQHLLFRCSLSQEVLHRVCRWWEIDFQLWRSFSEWDAWFSSIRLPGSVK
ncbi:RNA-directed DNA polymerase, eukaryota, reverse transcriptase zinc-binding domain protein, partial [Tanacetum coccineum]